MSFPQDRRRRGGAGTGFSSSGQRTALGYYVPLALTVGVAAVSIAAWIWSERHEDDDDDEHPPDGGNYYPPPDASSAGYPPPAYGASDFARGPDGEVLPGDTPYDPSFMGRMQGALRRTPSPQQLFDGASRRVVAGVTAAGQFVGGALTSIREENRGDFEDHSRWSEEAQSRAHERSQQDSMPTMSGALPSRGPGQQAFDKKKKTVVIVVSSLIPSDSDELISEHAVCTAIALFQLRYSKFTNVCYSPSYPTFQSMLTWKLPVSSFLFTHPV